MHAMAMRCMLRSDAVNVLLYLLATAVLACALLPWIDRFASAMASIALGKQTNFLLRASSSWALRASMVDSLRVALLVAGVLLLPALFAFLGRGRLRYRVQKRPWRLLLRARSQSSLVSPQTVLKMGFFTAALLAFLFAASTVVVCLLVTQWVHLVALVWPDAVPGMWSPVLKAVALALVIEVILRGVLLGVFMRAMAVPMAIVLTAWIGCLGYFLDLPPHWVDPLDISWDSAGPVLLSLLQHAMEPQRLICEFIPLLMAGVLLGQARYRSGSLALPLGVHAGLAAVLAVPALPPVLMVLPMVGVNATPLILAITLLLLFALGIFVSRSSPKVYESW